MKTLVLSLAAVAVLSLSGCAAYVGDPYGGYGYPAAPYAYGPSVSLGVYGGYGYGHGYGHGWRDGEGRWHDGDHRR